MGFESESKTWQAYYSVEELHYGRRIKRKDIIGIPLFIAWYFFLAYVLNVLAVVVRHSSENVPVETPPHLPIATPPVIVVVQCILAIVAVGAACLQNSQLPPRANDDSYHAQSLIGGWVFLTKHCLTLQAVHQVASFMAGALPANFVSVVPLVNCMSICIGSLGFFVTVQYFELVHFNPDFVTMCTERISRDPPDNLRRNSFLVHIFALPLAVMDITVGKSHTQLHEVSSFGVTLAMQFFYVIFYLSAIAVNFKATGHWPYAVLKQFKTLRSWANFVFVQTTTLSVFCSILWCISCSPSAW